MGFKLVDSECSVYQLLVDTDGQLELESRLLLLPAGLSTKLRLTGPAHGGLRAKRVFSALHTSTRVINESALKKERVTNETAPNVQYYGTLVLRVFLWTSLSQKKLTSGSGILLRVGQLVQVQVGAVLGGPRGLPSAPLAP